MKGEIGFLIALSDANRIFIWFVANSSSSCYIITVSEEYLESEKPKRELFNAIMHDDWRYTQERLYNIWIHFNRARIIANRARRALHSLLNFRNVQSITYQSRSKIFDSSLATRQYIHNTA
jgi:hypothetical protein